MSKPKAPDDIESSEQESDNRKTQKALRIVGVVSSIVGLVSFALFIYVTVRNRLLEQENVRRTEQFLVASEQFTATLNARESQLRQTTDRLEAHSRKLGSQAETLRAIERKLDQLNGGFRQQQIDDGTFAPAALQTLWDQ